MQSDEDELVFESIYDTERSDDDLYFTPSYSDVEEDDYVVDSIFDVQTYLNIADTKRSEIERVMMKYGELNMRCMSHPFLVKQVAFREIVAASKIINRRVSSDTFAMYLNNCLHSSHDTIDLRHAAFAYNRFISREASTSDLYAFFNTQRSKRIDELYESVTDAYKEYSSVLSHLVSSFALMSVYNALNERVDNYDSYLLCSYAMKEQMNAYIPMPLAVSGSGALGASAYSVKERFERFVDAVLHSLISHCNFANDTLRYKEHAHSLYTKRGDKLDVLLDTISQYEYVNTAIIERECSVSKMTATRYLNELEECSLITEITKQSRFKLYKIAL